MRKDLQHIDDHFRKAYLEYEESPSPQVWEKLASFLDQKKPRTIFPSIFIRNSAIFSGILIAAAMGIFNSGLQKQNNKAIQQNIFTINHSDQTDQALPYKKSTSSFSADKKADYSEPIANSSFGTFYPEKQSLLKHKQHPHSPGQFTESAKSNENENTFRQSPAIQTTHPIASLSAPFYSPFNLSVSAISPDWKNPVTKKIHVKEPFQKYWRISLVTGYEVAGYHLDCDDPAISKRIRHNEVFEPSFMLAMLASRQMTKNWALQSGLIYSHTAIGIHPQKIYAFQDPTGDIAYKYTSSTGYVYLKPGFNSAPSFGDSLIAEAKHTLKSISIPLIIRYRTEKNKFSITPGIGVEGGIITSASAEIELTDDNHQESAIVNKLNGTRKVFWQLSADVDLQYQLNKRTSVTVQPVFRHSLSPITENNVVETFPYSVGIRAGVTIKF